MTAYADYSFYESEYMGHQLSDSEFRILTGKASCYIDTITYGRLCSGCDVPEAVKFAVCAVADELYRQDKETSKRGVSSENTDGYSISYKEQTNEQNKQRLMEAAGLYLPRSHPLRYAGV